MALLADARRQALAEGGGGRVTRPGWERDIEGGVIVFDVAKLDVAKSNRKPRGVAWEDAIADDWVACNERGELTGEVATESSSFFDRSPLDITGDIDPAEYVAGLRGCAPDPVRIVDDVRERLAAWCHEQQWSGWMRYLFGRCLPCGGTGVRIPKEWAERWQHQVDTPYADLSEAEKESDWAGPQRTEGDWAQPTASDWEQACREVSTGQSLDQQDAARWIAGRARELAAQRSAGGGE